MQFIRIYRTNFPHIFGTQKIFRGDRPSECPHAMGVCPEISVLWVRRPKAHAMARTDRFLFPTPPTHRGRPDTTVPEHHTSTGDAQPPRPCPWACRRARKSPSKMCFFDVLVSSLISSCVPLFKDKGWMEPYHQTGLNKRDKDFDENLFWRPYCQTRGDRS